MSRIMTEKYYSGLYRHMHVCVLISCPNFNISSYILSLVRPPDGQWGVMAENGTYTSGLLRQLQQGQVDISVAGYTASYHRTQSFDFLRPVVRTQYRLYIKNPESTFNWMPFVAPFSADTWAVLVTLAVVVPFFLALSAKMPPQVRYDV